MKKILIALLLFLAQIWLTFKGVHVFSKYGSPLIFFAASAGLALLYRVKLARGYSMDTPRPAPLRNKWLGALTGAVSIGLCYEELRKMFVQYKNPRDFSDVIPQLETLYNRFAHGQFPYAPVDMGGYSPYPVYMPLHWLPIGIPEALGIDLRWIGFGLMVLAAGLYGWQIMQGNRPLWSQLLAIVLPSISVWGYILWGEIDLPVSLETVIAAYYLVLASGLGSRKVSWITVGLVLCLLSRYTLVFWIPLFAILFWTNMPRRQNVRVWLTVAASVVLLYVIPFYLKDPTILTKGVAYHNQACEDEWKGYGDPPVSWTMERGIHFAIQLKGILPGDAVHQVFLARVLQGSIMLLLLGLGLWDYRRNRNRIHHLDYSLLMLYVVVLCFYCFGPLTYRYYLIVLHVLAAVVCGKIILAPDKYPDKAEA